MRVRAVRVRGVCVRAVRVRAVAVWVVAVWVVAVIIGAIGAPFATIPTIVKTVVVAGSRRAARLRLDAIEVRAEEEEEEPSMCHGRRRSSAPKGAAAHGGLRIRGMAPIPVSVSALRTLAARALPRDLPLLIETCIRQMS